MKLSSLVHPFYVGIRIFFSSPESLPEPKAHVSFSDQNLPFVHRRCCRKLFTFSSSSPELLGEYQPNLAQSIIG